VVLTVTESEIADKIMEAIKLNTAFRTEARYLFYFTGIESGWLEKKVLIGVRWY